MKKKISTKAPHLSAFLQKRGRPDIAINYKEIKQICEKRWQNKPYSFLLDIFDELVSYVGSRGDEGELIGASNIYRLEDFIEMLITPSHPTSLFTQDKTPSNKKLGKQKIVRIKKYEIMKKCADLLGDMKLKNDEKSWLGVQFSKELNTSMQSFVNAFDQFNEIRTLYELKLEQGSLSAYKLIDNLGYSMRAFSEFSHALILDLNHNKIKTYRTSKFSVKKVKQKLKYIKPKDRGKKDW